MSEIGKAIAGVAASGAVLMGGYGLSILEAGQERTAISHCADTFEGKAEEKCVDIARNSSHEGIFPSVLATIGLAGVIGCGYIAYRTLKEELGTTGPIEDH